MGFVHLHLHTQYSLLDGAIRLSDLFPACKAMGFPAVAMTDHGNMFGAVKFYAEAKKAKIRPILGSEVYVTQDHRHKEKGTALWHLVLLAKDNEGYRNLSKLSSLGYLEGFYSKPRVDKAQLRTYAKGLIGLSGCLSGEIPEQILAGRMDEASAAVREYAEIFEPGCFYIEVQKNGLVDQDTANVELLNLAELHRLPLVATNDCHFLRREDHEAHEVLLCIQTGHLLSDEKRLSFSSDQFYLKTAQEMYDQFGGLETALENTERIAAQCNVQLDLGKFKLPRFPVPAGETPASYLRRLSEEGLRKRIEATRRRGEEIRDDAVYWKRLEYELGVIESMGFPDYYLIVWDFIRKARESGVPVGPGRGSGAGSLVAYAVGITQLDPIRFDLLFERFLNPQRIDLPDFDVDFCQRKRDKVIEYVTERYGKDRVCQIVTYGSLNAKGAVRDVGRVLGFSYSETDKISKMLPDGPPDPKKNLAKIVDENPELKATIQKDPKLGRLMKIAGALEKLNRQLGVHAAGVVISAEPLFEELPLATGKNDEVITQFAKEEVEKVGLVKFDFLGLKTLTVLDDTMELIRKNGKVPPDLPELPLDRKEVYELIASGETTGVFQMESSGFRKLLRKLGPDRFDDIIAVLALYRPGPLGGGMVDEYVRRKRGEERTQYAIPALEPILQDTYGVIVYQEQVMRIATDVAGFTMSAADEFRKVIAKKKTEKIPEVKADFLAGGGKAGHSAAFLEELFSGIDKFAEYGFNKSHSAAYAFVAYWTAYLKANFPVEFTAALMSLDKDKPDKMVAYLAECRRMKIPVAVPHINKSESNFTADGESIVFGLSGIRNVGETAVEGVIAERQRGGPFKSFADFLARVDGKRINRRVLEGLIAAGAFDTFGIARTRMLDDLDRAMAIAAADQRDKAYGRKSLFGKPGPKKGTAAEGRTEAVAAPAGATAMNLDRKALQAERDAVGFYLSGHPLDRYAGMLPQLTTHRISDLEGLGNGARVALAGIVSSLQEFKGKTGNGRLAKFYLEDRYGMVQVLAFSSVYEPARELLAGPDPVLVQGTLKVEEEGESTVFHVRAESVMAIADAANRFTRRVELSLRPDQLAAETFESLKRVFSTHSGDCPVTLELVLPGQGKVRVEVSRKFGLRLGDESLHELATVVGSSAVHFHVHVPGPQG